MDFLIFCCRFSVSVNMAEADTQSLVAIFWDIENCSVPRGKSAIAVVHCIREAFLNDNMKEAEFLCVCDVSKESAALISDLNDSQVTSYAF